MAIRRCGPDRRRGRGGRWPRRRLGRDHADGIARPHRRRAVGGERLVCAHRQFRLARFHRAHWPSFPDAAHRGVPDRSKSLGDESKRVWETFKSDYELFPIGDDVAGAAPSPWTNYDGRNPCGDGIDNREKTIASFEPFADFNQPSFTVGVPAIPLVGVNGAYTRYEIHFNEAEFSAFVASGWAQAQNLPDESHPAHLPAGSVAIKAAWLPMSEAEARAARGRYYLETAEIVDVARTLKAGRVVCSKSAVALVGLHIAIKTLSRPQWVWSTFEHVDNVPPAGAGEAREPDAKDAGRPYAYFDPSRPGSSLAAIRLGRRRAGRLDEPAPAPSGADAGGAALPDPWANHGDEPRLLGPAGDQGNGLGALHARR